VKVELSGSGLHGFSSDFSKVLGGVLDCIRRRFEIVINRWFGLASCHDIILYVMCGYQQIIAQGIDSHVQPCRSSEGYTELEEVVRHGLLRRHASRILRCGFEDPVPPAGSHLSLLFSRLENTC
jgi:hypothetical protein